MSRNTQHADYNHKTLQSIGSNVCGYYALHFLYHRCRGILLNDIINMFTEDTRMNDFQVKRFIESKFDTPCVSLSQMQTSVSMHKALYK